jgi:hypothetical protein
LLTGCAGGGGKESSRLAGNEPTRPFLLLPPTPFYFETDDPGLALAFEQLPPSRVVFRRKDPTSGTTAQARISVETDYSVSRKANPRMYANVVTVCLGFFFFYYNVDVESNSTVRIWTSEGSEAQVLSVPCRSRYRHPGYIPKAEEERLHKVLFYQDVLELHKELTSQRVAEEVARWLTAPKGTESP